MAIFVIRICRSHLNGVLNGFIYKNAPAPRTGVHHLSLMRKILFMLSLLTAVVATGTTFNIAPLATPSASSCAPGCDVSGINDGIVRISGQGEWASADQETFWGEINFPWVRLDWDAPVEIDRIVLYDRVSDVSHTAGVTLRFSDNSTMDVGEIPENGAPREINLNGISTSYVIVQLTDGDGSHLGLSEIEVFPTAGCGGDYVSAVNPFVETTRGRYFFFISGCQPFGMIGAAPMTRNKNQGGGGYNYNDRHILGFPQIHAWMLSGLTFMPANAGVEPWKGEEAWKSAFSHAGEIARPGYHRVYLDDYGVWVEQTATQRTSFYRMKYTDDSEASLLFNLGGYVATSTMVDADVKAVSDHRLEGSFSTVGRLWGGPDSVKVFFVAEFGKPFKRLDSWDASGVTGNVTGLHATDRSVARNEGMSYHDAPTAGLNAVFDVKAGESVCVKMAISYTSIENASLNLATESPGWDFDEVAKSSQAEWNEWLGRIDVKGGTPQQRVKFYTDLWHTLLGRHKINDVNGSYPDRTEGGRIEGKNVINPRFKIRQAPLGKDGTPRFNMYNSDALWLTQWNQNTLWGLAWPCVLDDVSASMLEYAYNGGLLPRGPCGGGYSFIMSGSPATSLITSAFQRDITHKWDVRKAYKAIRRNHERGGMLGFNYENEFEFYDRHGYAPDRGGVTVQWSFEDWALSQMARKLGYRKDARRFEKRSEGWRQCIHPDIRLLFPRREDGSWLHTDPFNGWGFEEANSWQTTFGLSHDIAGLAEAMGGGDTLCSMLDHAMRQSVDGDFVAGYGSGYVSYANQPGLSTAHIFSHAGKPWLTQYWVRQVKEQAYGSISPSKGYGGHDEDQGQMSGVSALMAIGLFSINGGSAIDPSYEITSPVFDEITISLDQEYYKGKEFKIIVHNNSKENCYISKALLNGREHNSFRLAHDQFAAGGILELWLDSVPNKSWGLGDAAAQTAAEGI